MNLEAEENDDIFDVANKIITLASVVGWVDAMEPAIIKLEEIMEANYSKEIKLKLMPLLDKLRTIKFRHYAIN